MLIKPFFFYQIKRITLEIPTFNSPFSARTELVLG